MAEEWKEIPFSKKYEVSNLGNIQSSKIIFSIY